MVKRMVGSLAHAWSLGSFRHTGHASKQRSGKRSGRLSAQPGIAADRFAREIVRFLKAFPGALAAAECQAVGPPSIFSPASRMPDYGVYSWNA